MITRKELKIIKEEELEGDLMDVVDLLMNLRETALEKGYTAIELERYYGDQDGYLTITGIMAKDVDRFDTAYWETLDDELEYDDAFDDE